MEVCADRLASVRAARAGGAARIEACSALSEGGLTPTPGFVSSAKAAFAGGDVFALIRPRGGDFLYSDEEVESMLEDIRALKAAGADGFVIGCLTEEGEVDKEKCAKLVSACSGLPVTFHRAFDMAKDPDRAIAAVISLGCSRLLTSGGARSAPAGKELIARLVREHGDEISVMPGGGISAENLPDMLSVTGVSEFHASARSRVESAMKFRNESCSMGSGWGEDEYAAMVTDEAKVARMVAIYSEAVVAAKQS